jgi:hypothetical protein
MAQLLGKYRHRSHWPSSATAYANSTACDSRIANRPISVKRQNAINSGGSAREPARMRKREIEH